MRALVPTVQLAIFILETRSIDRCTYKEFHFNMHTTNHYWSVNTAALGSTTQRAEVMVMICDIVVTQEVACIIHVAPVSFWRPALT